MTSGGSSDRTTAPTIQKMLVTTAQRHSRVSDHNSPSNLVVEPRTLGSIARSGAACAVLGIKRLEPQHSMAKSIINTASIAGSPPPVIATPPVIVPQMIGKDAVFDRPEQRADHAEQKQRQEQQWQRVQLEPGDGDARRADFGELQPSRHQRLVEAISELAAEGRQQKKRRDKNAARQCHQRLGCLAADLEQDQQGERVLQEIVVEGREELAPEQWREAPRSEK